MKPLLFIAVLFVTWTICAADEHPEGVAGSPATEDDFTALVQASAKLNAAIKRAHETFERTEEEIAVTRRHVEEFTSFMRRAQEEFELVVQREQARIAAADHPVLYSGPAQ